ncbi:uracil-DNA glycosylase [Rothia sp. ZJ1223]|uniref:uracil-DNA glycosylase n=1 Tax=Rothia sp. ZJ1223 TaxID=2811098 RepID=UPI00195EDD7D|nr:uracil-DNA glycosylase [Rothia sp. ZJ1223]MBM7052044.1 uracil-DNA glycosylase [Rothia sp. ZJ1223]
MPARPLNEIMAADWAHALAPVEENIRAMGNFLREEHAAGRATLPPASVIFRAFERPMSEVKVLVIGQDPYPTPGHAMGLSFSVQPDVRPVPRSLQNIYKELHTDLGITPPAHGDLSAWSNQGVMLLNRVLSVGAGDAGSHRNKGWETITTCAITALAQRGTPLVGILWGADARKCKPLLGGYPCVESAHPSPLSASRGFFGSRPFSHTNDLLIQQGAQSVNWQLPASA